MLSVFLDIVRKATRRWRYLNSVQFRSALARALMVGGGAKGSSLPASSDRPPRAVQSLRKWAEDTMKTAILAVVVCLSSVLTACGQGQCAPRSGTYRVTFTWLRGGYCGSIPQQVGPVDDSTPPLQLGCTGERTKSADSCTVDAMELACPDGSMKLTGTLEWNADSTNGHGEILVEVPGTGGSPDCSGTYSVVYVKV